MDASLEGLAPRLRSKELAETIHSMGKKAGSEEILQEVFGGGGEMGRRMRAFDWARTELGPAETWPQALRVAVRILLGSGYSMYIGWGPRFIQFYNDAYIPILGEKHPAALGLGTPQTFPEIWEFIGPMFRRVMEEGEATTLFDQILFLERNGYAEECYFTFSYSPIPSDKPRQPGGVFVTALETTEKVIEERRLTLLRDLASANSEARGRQDMLQLAAQVLQGDLHDMPFSLLYAYDGKTGTANLPGSAGLAFGDELAPKSVEVGGTSIWPFDAVLKSGRPARVVNLANIARELPKGPWAVGPTEVVVLPIQTTGQNEPYGFLIVGVNPHKRLDAKYEAFLERAASQIARNVGDALAYESERRRAEQLAALDHAKTAFFSNVSHEFRTPLTLLLGPLEQLIAKSDEEIRPENRSLAEVAHRNGVRLLKLVNMLLDFSRIEAGRVQAVYQPTELAGFTKELASGFESATERAGLKLRMRCAALKAPVYVDREMWEKIVLNLLSNAFKFTFEGTIDICVRENGNSVELTVTDTGVGIPEAELSKVFERFHRVEGSQGRSFEGSGIGLALVHELVKLHGGRIEVESTLRRGSTFKVSIPKGSAHLPKEQVRAGRDGENSRQVAESYVDEATRWLPDDGEENSSLLSKGPETDATGVEGSTILLADDNADMREYMRRLLERHYVVTAVTNGQAALDAVRRQAPDLVITDIMMPLLDGFGLVTAIREDSATRLIPVLMLSARAGEDSRVEGLQGGADDYLVKPFTTRELLARVRSHLTMAKLRREAAERERELRAEITAEHNRLRDLFMNAPFPIAMLEGPEHRFDLANQKMADLLGRSLHEMIGKRHRDVVVELVNDPFNRLLDEVYSTGRPYFGNEMAAKLNRTDMPEDGYFNFVYQPTRDAHGKIDGILVAAFDVTDQVRARTAVEKSETSLRFAQKAANIGSWELNVSSDEFSWSEDAARMIGRPGVLNSSRADFLNHLNYSADRENFSKALDRTLKKRAPFEAEFRVELDGAVSLLSARATMFFNQGSPLLIGFFIDVGNEARTSGKRKNS